MVAKVIDGRKKALEIREKIAGQVKLLDFKPSLAVVIVGEDPASLRYVRHKRLACEEAGIHSEQHSLPANSDFNVVAQKIDMLNHDDSVHGILVQLPLPNDLKSRERDLINLIDPDKDVDGLTTLNLGRLFADEDGLRPCTPSGCEILLKDVFSDMSGKTAVVIGRSLLAGRPMEQILLQNDVTPTICFAKSPNVKEVCKTADIVIAAAGSAEFIDKSWVKDGACLIDIGINENADGNLVGDFDFNSVLEKAGSVTPVPGGVGPMTIAVLLYNTLKAACAQENKQLQLKL